MLPPDVSSFVSFCFFAVFLLLASVFLLLLLLPFQHAHRSCSPFLQGFGWSPVPDSTNNWAKLSDAVQDHISSLNFGYRVELRTKGVTYINAYGSFVDPHTLECVDKRGKRSTLTSRRFVVAVGGRPRPLDIPGGELAISSDDIFAKPSPPGKTLCVGASYVALECAGFLTGLGYDTTVAVRSILLRGFDQEVADIIGKGMEKHGTKMLRGVVPTSIVKQDDGKLLVTLKDKAGVETSDVFDTVLCAIGRDAVTAGVALDKAGVVAKPNGKLDANNEQTNVPVRCRSVLFSLLHFSFLVLYIYFCTFSVVCFLTLACDCPLFFLRSFLQHIYAVGDVLDGRPELTPVAIQAGRLLADRLYGGSSATMQYELVPTTVFTPDEYGCIGLSEEAAKESHGEDNLDVYLLGFKPLEYNLSRPTGAAFIKLLCDKTRDGLVVGLHYLGPNAGEVTQVCALLLVHVAPCCFWSLCLRLTCCPRLCFPQGFAVAMRMGATYTTFKDTVGIHPTCAEEFTTLSVTRASGEDFDKGGC